MVSPKTEVCTPTSTRPPPSPKLLWTPIPAKSPVVERRPKGGGGGQVEGKEAGEVEEMGGTLQRRVPPFLEEGKEEELLPL